jgi:hypothetical protein
MVSVCGQRFRFGEKLHCDDDLLRDDTLAELILWLSEQKTMTEGDAERIWFVLYQGLWKIDKVIARQDYCKKAASAVFDMPVHLVEPFIHGFFVRISKTWSDMEELRRQHFSVLMGFFLDNIVQWARHKSQCQILPRLFRTILNLPESNGLQLLFVDAIVPHLPELTRSNPGDSTIFVTPFTEVFTHLESDQDLVKRIDQKLIFPLVQSDGDLLFGPDSDSVLRLFRSLIEDLRAALANGDSDSAIAKLRSGTLARLKERVTVIQRLKEACGEPLSKEIPE